MGDYSAKDAARSVKPKSMTGPDRYRGLPPISWSEKCLTCM